MRLDEAEACASVAEEDGAAEALVEALAEGVADEELLRGGVLGSAGAEQKRRHREGAQSAEATGF